MNNYHSKTMETPIFNAGQADDDETTCNPIILNVRGNATDIDDVGNLTVSNISTDPTTSNISTPALFLTNADSVSNQSSNILPDKQNSNVESEYSADSMALSTTPISLISDVHIVTADSDQSPYSNVVQDSEENPGMELDDQTISNISANPTATNITTSGLLVSNVHTVSVGSDQPPNINILPGGEKNRDVDSTDPTISTISSGSAASNITTSASFINNVHTISDTSDQPLSVNILSGDKQNTRIEFTDPTNSNVSADSMASSIISASLVSNVDTANAASDQPSDIDILPKGEKNHNTEFMDQTTSNISSDPPATSITTSGLLVSNVHTVSVEGDQPPDILASDTQNSTTGAIVASTRSTDVNDSLISMAASYMNSACDPQNPATGAIVASSRSTDSNDSLISTAVSYMNSVTNANNLPKVAENSLISTGSTNHPRSDFEASSLLHSLSNAIESGGENQINRNSISRADVLAAISLSAQSKSSDSTIVSDSRIGSISSNTYAMNIIPSNANKQLKLSTKAPQGPSITVLVKNSQSKSHPNVVSRKVIKRSVINQPVNVNKQLTPRDMAIAAANKIYSEPCLRALSVLQMSEVFETTMLDPTPTSKPKDSWKTEYVCLVCGDEFHTRAFLNHHLTRRVFELDYYCVICNKTIRFYNKCNFWLHQSQVHSFKMEKNSVRTSGSISWKPYIGPCVQDVHFSDFPNPPTCTSCLRHFNLYHDLLYHFQRYLSPPFSKSCKICQMSFSNPCAYTAHCSIHDAGKKKVTCPECGESFDRSTLASLFEHLDSCHHFNVTHKIKCACEQVLPSVHKFKRHLIKSHTKVVLRCHVCDCQCSSFSLMAQHYKQHTVPASPSSIVFCTICRRSLSNCQKLKVHIDNHVEMNFRVCSKKLYSCFLCDETFTSSTLLDTHVEHKHTHKPKRCTICFGLFGSRQKLVEHIMSKTCSSKRLPLKFHICMDMPMQEEAIDWAVYNELFKVYEPPVSSVTLTPTASKRKLIVSLPGMTSSGQRHSNTISNSNRDYPSPIQKEKSLSIVCVEPNSSQNSLLAVSQATSSTGNLVPIAPKPSDGKKFQCHSCKIIIQGTNLYTDHMVLHEKSRATRHIKKSCGICRKSVDDDLFESHMEDHQKAGIIVCTLCHSRQFNSMSDALQHSKNLCFYKVVHGDGASFIEKNTVQNTDESESNITSAATSMETQSDVVSNEPERSVYPCLLCGFAFQTKEDKEDHVSRIHDGTRTLYYCLMCKRKGSEKSFSKKKMLTKHISLKHRIINPEEIAKLIHEEEQNVMSGQVVVPTFENSVCNTGVSSPKRLRLATEGEFVCGKCGYSTEDSSHFQEHIGLHNSKKEPQCQECGLCFTVLAALKTHLFVVHKIKAVDEYLKEKGWLDSESEEDDEIGEESFDISDSGCVMVDETLQSESNGSHSQQKEHKSKQKGLLECTVCYRSFSSQIVLKKHMRSHGMAFIHSNRHDKQ